MRAILAERLEEDKQQSRSLPRPAHNRAAGRTKLERMLNLQDVSKLIVQPWQIPTPHALMGLSNSLRASIVMSNSSYRLAC